MQLSNKKHFNKELVMTKEGNEDFKNSGKCWIGDTDYLDNINLKLNYKNPIIFYNLRNYDSHLIMQDSI